MFSKCWFSFCFKISLSHPRRQPHLKGRSQEPCSRLSCHYTESLSLSQEWKSFWSFIHQGKPFPGDGRIVAILTPSPPSCVVLGGQVTALLRLRFPIYKGSLTGYSAVYARGKTRAPVTLLIRWPGAPGLSRSVTVFSRCPSRLVIALPWSEVGWFGQ